MLKLSNLKFQQLFVGVTGDTSTTYASNLIDTLEADEILMLVQEYSTTTTTVAKVLQIEECDTSNGSFATFSGGRGGTDFTCVAVPSVQSNVSSVQYALHVRHGGARQRYLRVKWTPGGTANTIMGTAILARLGQTPASDTLAQVGLSVRT